MMVLFIIRGQAVQMGQTRNRSLCPAWLSFMFSARESLILDDHCHHLSTLWYNKFVQSWASIVFD
jgi:hypothetical protein